MVNNGKNPTATRAVGVSVLLCLCSCKREATFESRTISVQIADRQKLAHCILMYLKTISGSLSVGRSTEASFSSSAEAGYAKIYLQRVSMMLSQASEITFRLTNPSRSHATSFALFQSAWESLNAMRVLRARRTTAVVPTMMPREQQTINSASPLYFLYGEEVILLVES